MRVSFDEVKSVELKLDWEDQAFKNAIYLKINQHPPYSKEVIDYLWLHCRTDEETLKVLEHIRDAADRLIECLRIEEMQDEV